MQTIFSSKKLSKGYATFTLQPFDLTLELGKIYGVVGENAAGKTTLLRIIAHDLSEDSGEYAYRFSLKNLENWEIAKDKIAYITQELEDWKGTMYEYVLFSAVSHGLTPEEALFSTEKTMERLGISDLGNRAWSEISGGYKLRFALAAAFVWHPKLVVMDEPLANLDIATQHLILEAMREFAQDKNHPKAIVISSQHLVEIENVADDLIYVEKGKVLFSGNKNTFGSDRTSNSFELNCNAEIETLHQIFANQSAIKITHSGFDLLLTTPLEISSADLLKTLLVNNIEVNYFRNISQSSKKMFIHE
jgi:ABC-2 type transport system ATP-binding protein